MQREKETRQRVKIYSQQRKKEFAGIFFFQGFLRSCFQTVARLVGIQITPGMHYGALTSRSNANPCWIITGTSPHWIITLHSWDMG